MKPFSRKGLHRVKCACGGFAYATVAELEHGIPACGRCGSVMEPERLELAMILEARDSAIMVAWLATTDDKIKSQTRSLRGPENVARRQSAGTLRSMEGAAWDEITATQRAESCWRQIAALKPSLSTPEPMPF